MKQAKTRSFHEEIARNKRDSVLIIMGVALIWAALGLSIGFAFNQPFVGAAVAAGITFIQILVLAGAGNSIALVMMGAKEAEPAKYPVLHNVVEEMAIASGLPKPKVYVIHTPAMNAFATGMSPEKSAIAVTTGLMRNLNRDELQGVVAHEMSHIRNYDIRVAIILAVMVGSIVMLSDFFLRWAFWGGSSRSSDDNKGGQAQAIFMLIALLFAILAPIFAVMLQMAVSRRREYLADASAAELTRYPMGLENALRKLASPDAPKYKESGKTFSHLFIVNPLRHAKQSSSVFDTHPPIRERIARLEQMAYQFRESE
ncbi:MAG: zinc metalloprotease HtpX [Planctomycetota bacterium]